MGTWLKNLIGLTMKRVPLLTFRKKTLFHRKIYYKLNYNNSMKFSPIIIIIIESI